MNKTEEIKKIKPEELERAGILHAAPDGKYICPHCGNGTGEHGTGCSMDLVDDAYILHCFKCGESMTAIKILQIERGLDYKDAAKVLSETFGLEKAKTPEATPEQVMRFVLDAEKNLENFPGFEGGFYRGLPVQTYKDYHCGYSVRRAEYGTTEYKYMHCDGRQRLIIPTDKLDHYLARYVGKAKIEGKFADSVNKPHCRSKDLFGLNRALSKLRAGAKTLFVVEGEIDAMSLDYKGYAAVSLEGQPPKFTKKYGGKTNQARIYKEIENLPAILPQDTFIILLPDNDADTFTHNRILDNFNQCAVHLRNLGLPAFVVSNVADYFDKQKDVNDLLVNAAPDFNIIIDRIIADATPNFKPILESLREIKANPPIDTDFEIDNDGNIRQKIMTSAAKWKGAPVDLTLPYNYAYSDDAIYTSGKPKRITNTPLLVTKIYQSPDGSDREYKLAAYQNGSWRMLRNTLPQVTLAQPGKLAQFLAREGISVVSGGRDKKLAEFLDDLIFAPGNLDKLPVCTLYKQSGWYDGKFILPPGDGDDYLVKYRSFNYKEIFSDSGKPQDWLKMFTKVYKASYSARLVLGASLVAPCLDLFKCGGEKNPVRNLQVHLNLPSGHGKSALAKFAMSLWGNPAPGKLQYSFNTTANALDLVPVAFNSLPVWIDELQSANQKMLENISTSVYNFETGSTRSKLTKDSEFIEKESFRGVRITTGEMPLLPQGAGQGAMRRLLELSVDKCLEENFASEVHGFCENNFGHFGKKWVKYLENHKAELNTFFNTYLFEYKDADFLMSDYCQNIAACHAALSCFLKMLGLDAILDVQAQCKSDFAKLANILPSKDFSRNSQRALLLIDDVCNMNRFNFQLQVQNADKELYITAEPKKEEWGVIFKNGDIAIYPTALRRILKDGGFPSPDPIVKDLAARGLLLYNGGETGGHRYQRRIKLDDNRSPWVFYFKAEAFAEHAAPSGNVKSSSTVDAPVASHDFYSNAVDPEEQYYINVQEEIDRERIRSDDALDEDLPF